MPADELARNRPRQGLDAADPAGSIEDAVRQASQILRRRAAVIGGSLYLGGPRPRRSTAERPPPASPEQPAAKPTIRRDG